MLHIARRPRTLAVLTLAFFGVLPAMGQTRTEDLKFSDQFDTGWSVGISGTTAIVGSPSDTPDGIPFTGSAFLIDTTTGDILFNLAASDGADGDRVGQSVGISGTTAIVGAPFDNNAMGSAYLFDTTTGNQLFKLTDPDAVANDIFGNSVAISGTIAIVGEPRDDDLGGSSGSAFVFDTTTGNQLFKLTASDGAGDDQFGWSVAISGTTAIVGAPTDDGMGSAYLFDTTTGNQLFKITASDGAGGDQFGTSVAISGTTAIVGAPNDDDAENDSGSAYLFDTTTGNQLFKITASDGALADKFGWSVALSGTTAIVGGQRTESAYQFDTTTGDQLFKLIASDGGPTAGLGYSVAFSGTTAIVGAPSDTNSTGSAYLYHFAPNIRQQPQSLVATDGESAIFSVQIADETDVNFQWRRNGVDLADAGNISGTQTPTLQIDATQSDVAYYDCVMTTMFASTTTDQTVLGILADPDACIVDLNNDGTLNFFDVSLFLQLFSAGCP